MYFHACVSQCTLLLHYFMCRSGKNELIGVGTTTLKDICPERYAHIELMH